MHLRNVLIPFAFATLAVAAPAAALAEEDLAAQVAALRAEVAALKAALEEMKASGPAAAAITAPVATGPAAPPGSLSGTATPQLAQAALAEAALAEAAPPKPAPAPPAVVASLPNGRPTLTSADGAFSAALNGVIQFDAGAYFQSENLGPALPVAMRDLSSGTTARRARIGFGGRAFQDFTYNLLFEFGGSGAEDAGRIQELWAEYDGFAPVRLRVGYFEPLVGLDANASTNAVALMERAAPAEVARSVAAGDVRAAAQVFGNGRFGRGADRGTRWLFALALTGGTGDSVGAGSGPIQRFDEQTAITGRLALAPYHGLDWTLHLGANVQHVLRPADRLGTGASDGARYTLQLRDRPELRVDGTRLVDTGQVPARTATVLGGELGGQYKNFFLEGEYFSYRLNGPAFSPRFEGWYAEGSWILTGEPRRYNPGNAAFNGPVPRRNFDPSNGGWGALELAGRYSDLDLNHRPGAAGQATPADGVRGGRQRIVSASLNWYLNPLTRFMLEGGDVRIDRLDGQGRPMDQRFNFVALRSQFAF